MIRLDFLRALVAPLLAPFWPRSLSERSVPEVPAPAMAAETFRLGDQRFSFASNLDDGPENLEWRRWGFHVGMDGEIAGPTSSFPYDFSCERQLIPSP